MESSKTMFTNDVGKQCLQNIFCETIFAINVKKRCLQKMLKKSKNFYIKCLYTMFTNNVYKPCFEIMFANRVYKSVRPYIFF